MKYTLKNKDIDLTDDEVKEIVKQNSEPKEEKKVGIAINTRLGSIIFQSSKTTIKQAIQEKGDANLSGADLRYADLLDANLCDADLCDADLRGANLRGAKLRDADLSGADLRYADLRDAEMQNVKFYGKGGTKKLTKKQLPDFLNALGFQVE